LVFLLVVWLAALTYLPYGQKAMKWIAWVGRQCHCNRKLFCLGII
jgi:hypothetical protein